jgi:hypothetical protein
MPTSTAIPTSSTRKKVASNAESPRPSMSHTRRGYDWKPPLSRPRAAQPTLAAPDRSDKGWPGRHVGRLTVARRNCERVNLIALLPQILGVLRSSGFAHTA